MLKRKILVAERCSLNSDGTYVYLDEYGTKEEAVQALNDAVLENFDYAMVEDEVEE
ncbi:hypothetical protein [Clostridium tyrobutyricum]|uniref:hypothetical protein n=1 Tax=Clostridium tyrobutyricum TaxID=1519 RepID=UPI0018A0FFA8|nr:hypothetical protein [Clostridium tyrobutyricum]